VGFLSGPRLRGYTAIFVGGLGLQYLLNAISALFSNEFVPFLSLGALSIICIVITYFSIKPFDIRIKFVMLALIFIWWIFLSVLLSVI
jgi:hypothetical protein